MQKQTKAYIFTLFAVTFWGTAASAFKIALQYVTPHILLFYSVLVSAIALFVILFLQGKMSLLFTIGPRQIGAAALLGLLNPFLYYIVLFKAYSLLPGQIAMSINYGWPLALTVLSVPILKQKLSQAQLIAIIISFIGALVIATKGQFASFGDVSKVGIILAFGSTLVWATFWLLNARDRLDPVMKLFVGFCFGLLYAVIFSAVFGGIQIPETQAFLPLVYIGLFEMGITFVLWLTALQLSSSAAKIGNLIYISPFLSLLFLRVIIGEEIHPATFVGLFLIVGSILFQEKHVSKTV
ncbi:MAG: DMT family transporter [Desulfobacterales bacterium]|nr:DMT family transporter [Desulfobacterales bacterium]